MEASIMLLGGIISIGAVWGMRCVWRAVNWAWLRPRKVERLLRQQGLSGNPYRLPFGDMMDFNRMKNEASSKPMEFSNHILSRVDPYFDHTIKKHGKDSFFWFGPIPIVTVTKPELIKEVYSKVYDFPKPDFGLVQKLVPGIAAYNGEKWAKHRKLINPAFHMEKLKLMVPAFYLSCNEMMKTWDNMVVSKTGSVEFDVWPHLVSLTSDVISRAAFGSSYVQGRKAFELIEEQIQIFLNSMQQSFIPGWSYLPTKANRRFEKSQNEALTLIKGIVDRRRIEMEAGEAMKDDLLGTLLKCNFKEMQQHGNKEIQLGLTIDEVIDECKLFYFAGQETTSVLLAYTMIMLGRYTDWQAKARQEVLETFGKSTPDFNGLNHLKIVTMILHEVLRLYPPVYAVWRRVANDTKLGKLSLPAGVYLNLGVICSHNDPEQWGDDVMEFNPERFSEGVSKATKESFAYSPFGLGPRVCVGQNLTLVEAKMAFAMILQRFSFELSPSYVHAPVRVLTMRPQFGAHIILHRL